MPNYKYEILKYWSDQINIYVKYAITDEVSGAKFNSMKLFDIGLVRDNYGLADDEVVRKRILNFLRKESGEEFTLPKASDLHDITYRIYKSLWENEDSMFCIESDEDIKNFDITPENYKLICNDIDKFHLEDYFERRGESLIIYAGLQACFNYDKLEKINELEIKNDKVITTNYEYEILNYWDNQNDFYVNYIVTDKTTGSKANTINFYNTYEISEYYDLLSEKEIHENVMRLLKNNSGNEFELPKVSEMSPLMKYIYNYVCDSESDMCHIDYNDWEELKEEEEFLEEDISTLKKEIEKYSLADYITLDDNDYKICGYGGLQCCFNNDSSERTEELER